MQKTKNNPEYVAELKCKILEAAMRAFVVKGIRGVKMEDVAKEVGISKRTLYEMYMSKSDVLYEGLLFYHQQREKKFEQASAKCRNVMEVVLTVYRMKVEQFKQTNPLFYSELVKYPQVQDYLNQHNQLVREKSLAFIQRGVDEGFFRKDLDYNLTGRLFDSLGRYIMQNELYRQYSIEAIFKNLVFVTLRGLCTEKGIKAIEEML